jgi:hypothetical protein
MLMPRHLKPYRQGALDSLCGVHAIINALHALRPGIAEKEAQKLFRVLVRAAVRKGALKVMWRGLDGTLFRHLLVLGVGRVATGEGVIIKVARPFATASVDLPSLIDTLRQALNGRCVAVTMIHTESWHWTVITRATGKSLFLFDSAGLKSIRIDKCAVQKGDSRYRINARELLILSAGSDND